MSLTVRVHSVAMRYDRYCEFCRLRELIPWRFDGVVAGRALLLRPSSGVASTTNATRQFCPNSAQQALSGSNKTAQNDTAQKLQTIVTARHCRSWAEWCPDF